MTRTGYSLEDIGRALPWGALHSFIKRLDLNSATLKELEPEVAEWAGTVKTNMILADIFDMLAQINANLCAKGSGKKPSKPKPYPRPGTETKVQKHIGKDGLPDNELREWIKNKQLNLARRESAKAEKR